MAPPSDLDLVAESITLAKALLAEAQRTQGAQERRRQRRLRRLIEAEGGITTVEVLSDEVGRITDPVRAARRLTEVARQAEGLGAIDRALLGTGARAARWLPGPVMALVRARLRHEMSAVVGWYDHDWLQRHLARTQVGGVTCNLNLLGEAIIGEREAAARLNAVLDLLAVPDTRCVSVKISSIYSQISPLAFDASVEALATRLRVLFDAAMARQPNALIYLDMEEYRDLALTVASFTKVLGEERYHRLTAGIALQAYLPDSWSVAEELKAFAMARVAIGGAPVRVRVVKGANLAMEQVEATLRGWEQAPFTTKAEVDANYKRLLDVLLDPAAHGAIVVGAASHNVFDVAWALTLRHHLDAPEQLEVEMLHGMAPSLAAATARRAGSLLLYTPITARDDATSAVAYLVRRLDENAAAQNFLRSMLDANPARLDEEEQRFRAAVLARRDPPPQRRRTQDRTMPPLAAPSGAFSNAADSDFALEANRRWITAALDAPLPPFPARTVTVDDVNLALDHASKAQQRWWEQPLSARKVLLAATAEALEVQRGALIAAMVRTTSKVVSEADVEVSEAVDFARYYASSVDAIATLRAQVLEDRPLGPIVVAAPWNFPLAIAAGGVFAGLAAGSAVVLKPAPAARALSFMLLDALEQAGAPEGLVQVLACDDDDAGQHLICHPSTGCVILTGSHGTAQLFSSWRPSIDLRAETSGKNAMVITAAADLDVAIRDLVRSAFGHAGQKCSAASLAIVEASVYDDPTFLERLADAAASLTVGPATDLTTTVPPVLPPPEAPLQRALTQLEDGERWLLEPRCLDGGHTWTPGIKVGVEAGSRSHRDEWFGPVLGVLRARDLGHAIELQNGTDFGLTAGLQSLDPAEIARWCDEVEAGNLYVNRTTTGAIVARQPFGGWKRSSVGPTAKAGGPHYVTSLVAWSSQHEPPIDELTTRFRQAYDDHFAQVHDHAKLTIEHNRYRYRPLTRPLGVLVGEASTPYERQIVEAAAATCGVSVVEVTDPMNPGVQRVRVLGRIDDACRTQLLDAGCTIDPTPPVPHPMVELPHYLLEQSISITAHRYGNPR